VEHQDQGIHLAEITIVKKTLPNTFIIIREDHLIGSRTDGMYLMRHLMSLPNPYPRP
jgi:hypothetical protein